LGSSQVGEMLGSSQVGEMWDRSSAPRDPRANKKPTASDAVDTEPHEAA